MKLRTNTVQIDGLPGGFTLSGRIYQWVSKRATTRLDFLPSNKRYNLTISDEKQFVWFRVAKVGTRSIFRAFEAASVPLSVENAIFAHYPVASYGNYFKFAFVRNPWERFVSAWHDKIIDRNHFELSPEHHARLKDFSRFVEFAESLDMKRCDVHLRLQSELIDLNQIDFLGRMETFGEDLQTVFAKLSIPAASVPKENSSSRSGDYRSHYTDELAARVAGLYQKDIAIFNYVF
jgi:hypothetical protein